MNAYVMLARKKPDSQRPESMETELHARNENKRTNRKTNPNTRHIAFTTFLQ